MKKEPIDKIVYHFAHIVSRACPATACPDASFADIVQDIWVEALDVTRNYDRSKGRYDHYVFGGLLMRHKQVIRNLWKSKRRYLSHSPHLEAYDFMNVCSKVFEQIDDGMSQILSGEDLEIAYTVLDAFVNPPKELHGIDSVSQVVQDIDIANYANITRQKLWRIKRKIRNVFEEVM